MRRLIVGLATTAVVSAGMGLAAVGPAGVAQAGPITWCPGDGSTLNKAPWPGFDWTRCHHWHYDTQAGLPGMVDDDTGIFHPAEGFPLPPSNPPPNQICIGQTLIGPGDPKKCLL
jgi:hypothetical protein